MTQELVRTAARDVDRARARSSRGSPDRVFAQWRALVDGRWSLVDHFERGGRRYVLAVPNTHDRTVASFATAREAQIASLVALGHTTKLIAYELGVARSTVVRHISRLLHHFGVTSRTELVRLLRAGASSTNRW